MAEAYELLDRPGAVVLGGGTTLNAGRAGSAVEVVDLQDLHLDGIVADADDALLIGATATLQQLVDDSRVPAVVREAARRDRPSTLRAQATVGGCVATGDPDSELLAALLVHDAIVHLGGPDGTDQRPLEVVLAGLPIEPGRVVTAVSMATSGRAAGARTARTRADRAIVAAFARQAGGERRIALTGIAHTPVLVAGPSEVDPIGDFRGSAEYRRSLATTLIARVLEALR